mgnify:CR=1 FL=1
MTSNGPDVRVLLVAAKDASDSDTVKNSGFVEVAPLKGNVGDQNYEPPADLDLFGEIQQIAIYFATTHGEKLAQQVGMDPDAYRIDMAAVKGSFGVDAGVERFTHRELVERRELIKKRLAARGRRRS